MVIAPELIAVLIALLALLLMYALIVFGRVIAGIFPSSLGVGPFSIHPRAWVQGGIDGLEAGVHWLVGDVIRPMIHFILAPVMAVINWAESLDYAISEAASGFEWLVNDGIPALRAGLIAGVDAVEASCKAVAVSLYNQAMRWLSAVEASCKAVAVSLFDQAMRWLSAVEASCKAVAVSLFDQAMARLSAVEADLGNEARALVKTAEADLVNELDQLAGTVKADLAQALDYAASEAGHALSAAESYATQAATAAVGVLVTDVDNVLAPVATGLIDDVGSLVGVIGSDFPDVGSLLRDLDLTKIGELAGGLAGALTIVRALTRLAEDCTVPNCRNLSGVGRLLQDLFTFVEGGAFLALVAALITDPEGTSNELHQLLDPIVSGGIDAARSSLGV